MVDLVIYGAGGFGRETALMVAQINQREPLWNLMGFCDDHVAKGETVDGLPVIGSHVELNELSSTPAVVIAVANPLERKAIRDRIHNHRVSFPALVHPSVLGGEDQRVHVGAGCIIAAGTILTTGIDIGAFTIINLCCTVGHDVRFGEYCAVMPGCSISGAVTLGDQVFVGTGARILQGISVGHKSTVGAGAVVTSDVEEGLTVVGIPARQIIRTSS